METQLILPTVSTHFSLWKNDLKLYNKYTDTFVIKQRVSQSCVKSTRR